MQIILGKLAIFLPFGSFTFLEKKLQQWIILLSLYNSFILLSSIWFYIQKKYDSRLWGSHEISPRHHFFLSLCMTTPFHFYDDKAQVTFQLFLNRQCSLGDYKIGQNRSLYKMMTHKLFIFGVNQDVMMLIEMDQNVIILQVFDTLLIQAHFSIVLYFHM